VIVTVTNPCGEIRRTLPVNVCQPLEQMGITGPTDLLVGQSRDYAATYTPPTATQPLTLTWSNGSIGPTATYSWTLPGHYPVTVTATNPCAQVEGTLHVTVCSLLENTDFYWTPLTPTVWAMVTFTGTADSLLPVSYTWNLGGAVAAARVITHTFTLTGNYRITMTTTNGCDQDVVQHQVQVMGFPYAVYLPLVTTWWNRCFLGPAGMWEVEDNDAFAQANGPLCSGEPYNGYPDDPDDYFHFDAGAGTVTVEMWDYEPGTLGQLVLYDNDSSTVGWDPDPSDGWLIQTDVDAGTYYARIYTADGYTPDDAYTLRVTFPRP
jgi:hypothetical protein